MSRCRFSLPKPLWEAHFDLGSGEPSTQTLAIRSPAPVEVAGHRIVHGGRFRESMMLTPGVRAAIAEETEIAPAHNRIELKAVEAVERVFGRGVKQIAVFDTGFHSTLAPAAYVYPGRYAWLEAGIRRYGFHGISHRYASRRAAEILGSDALRMIICHLGNGASLAAVRDGKSIDTTMGFTPLEGLMMGTRCGSIDPGILVYLLRHRGYTADQLDRILNQESGLLGLSGISGDMREILAARAAGNAARTGFRYLCAPSVPRDRRHAGGAGRSRRSGVHWRRRRKLRPVARARREAVRIRRCEFKTLVIHAEEEWEIARECFRIASA